ncbi:MAG: glutamate formimidoyltransferase [Prevotellaceae bacterium]|jgi:glutamate formiminotransferase/formiminotetrahydrofolate cyclodeaminase|nr:glutamate formimidoyltransferase [Prevotellaceae bacterium]
MLLECVPNFSEGRDFDIIRQICNEVERLAGVKLLNVDSGYSANRTVLTFAGNPEAVCEAAFRAMQKAGELIDMSKHCGTHPRTGATDVCPLIPLDGASMEEAVIYARKLAEKVGVELGIPVYCYEAAAFDLRRKNLAYCRRGEYEGLKTRISSEEGKPDFGPSVFDERIARTGLTSIGARDFLLAVNFNLNTTSAKLAKAIALDVREKGRIKPSAGEISKDADEKPARIPGSLKATKAIGWYIDEYGIAQVSMNITDLAVCPLHVAFDEVCRKANERGVRVTGAEIVGLTPKQALMEAGKHYLSNRNEKPSSASEEELIRIAIESMRLDELRPFVPDEKLIEYLLENNSLIKRISTN